jgi:DNA processing protein
LLLSEFPLGAPAYPQNFPIRNRIISGMSAGVVVVEGAQYSGSSITAKLAIDQGREVFAVPGNITSRQSWGPNLLIRQGARLIQDWNDVIADLAPEDRRRLAAANRRRAGDDADADAPAEQTPLPLGPATALGRRLLDRLKVDAATHVDQLVEGELDSTPSEVIAALFELEMLGMVRQLPGRNFVKAW